MYKRILSFTLSVILLLSLVSPYSAILVNATTVAAGECGDGVTWELSTDGVLTIDGKGKMKTFGVDDQPYYDYMNDIVRVNVGGGVENLSSFAFASCQNLIEVNLSEGLTTIDDCAFYDCTALSVIEIPTSVKYIDAYSFFGCSQELEIIRLNPKLAKHYDGSYRILDSVFVSGTYMYEYVQTVLDLMNAERTKVGAQKLTLSQVLLDSAMLRSCEISMTFGHNRPDGTLCFTVSEEIYGENIAFGLTSPERVMELWMNSTGHRENILNPSYTIAGIGCVKIGGVLYWVQLFGYSKPATAPKIPNSLEVTNEIIYEPSNFILNLALNMPNQLQKKQPLDVNETHGMYVYLQNDGIPGEFNFLSCNPESFSWYSSDEKVATVENGKITTIGDGKTTIKAITKLGTEITLEVEVKDSNPPKETHGILCDANLDGNIGIADLVELNKALVGIIESDDLARWNMQCSGNISDNVELEDAAVLISFLLGTTSTGQLKSGASINGKPYSYFYPNENPYLISYDKNNPSQADYFEYYKKGGWSS